MVSGGSPKEPASPELPTCNATSNSTDHSQTTTTKTTTEHPLEPKDSPNGQVSSSLVKGEFLSSRDLDAIGQFTRDFVATALIPHVQRLIKYYHEITVTRSKSKSLLSATKRWLGGAKSPASGHAGVVYSPEASELQTRRLGQSVNSVTVTDRSVNSVY